MAARSASAGNAVESLSSQRPWPWPHAVLCLPHHPDTHPGGHTYSLLGLWDWILYEDCRALWCSPIPLYSLRGRIKRELGPPCYAHICGFMKDLTCFSLKPEDNSAHRLCGALGLWSKCNIWTNVAEWMHPPAHPHAFPRRALTL